jgi:hypothetical protein
LLVSLKENYALFKALPTQLFELRDDQLEREPAYRILATEGSKFAGQALIDTGVMIDSQSQREATTENAAQLGDMAKFQGTFAAMFSAARGYVTTRNRIYRQEYEINLAANQIAWERLLKGRARLTDNQRTALDSVATNREAFVSLIPQSVFPALESDRYREDLYLFRTHALPLTDNMQTFLAASPPTRNNCCRTT